MGEEPRELPVKAIPKFASFRPKKDASKPLSPSDTVIEGSKHEATLTDERERKRAKHRHHSHHRQRFRRHYDQQLDQSPQEPFDHSPPEKPTTPDGNAQVFFSDRSGDENNLRYGSLHRYSVPTYWRGGVGNVIGLRRAERIDWSKSTEQQIVTHSDLFDRDSRKRKGLSGSIELQRELRVRPSQHSSAIEEQHADFLSLDGTDRRRRNSYDRAGSDEAESSANETTHYRSIEGKAKVSTVPEDPQLEYNDSAADQGEQGLEHKSALTKHMEIGARLSKVVEQNPQSGQAWLELLAHQDEKPLEHQTGSRHSRAEKLSNGEIKLSIYEKALGNVQEKLYKELLLDGMMEEASRHWDKGRLSRKWRSVLHENQDSLALWTTYLNFLQENFVSFRFDDIREAFTQCLKVCRRLNANHVNTLHYDIEIYIFVRMTICMRQAGFSELATAAWQAILEFNLCRPNPVDSETKDSPYKSFEDFWESEAPRIGELEARGWDDYELHGSQAPAQKTDIPKPEVGKGLNLGTWPINEDEQTMQGRRPARTMDDVGEDDPYRVILFSDIEPFLLHIPAYHRKSLLDAFLVFCGLPPWQTYGSQDMSRWRDPYLRDEDFTSTPVMERGTKEEEESRSLYQHLLTQSSLQNWLPFDFSTPCHLVSTDTLFASPGAWFDAFKPWIHGYQNNMGPLEVQWVRRALKTLVDRNADDEDIAEYFMAFEYKVFPESAKKTAKSLLKKRSSSLRLYNAYALVEFREAASSTAESVLNTALSMSKHQDDAVFLWRTWVWELMQNQGTTVALEKLLSFFDESAQIAKKATPIDPAAILKAQQKLIESRDRTLSQETSKHVAVYIECLILLSYLSSSEPLPAALSIFYSNLSSVLPHSLPPTFATHEYLHQAVARLLYYHATHTAPFQPSLIRSTLAKSIALFPHNTLFLSLYAWNEARFRIDDRVRSTIHTILSPARADGSKARESILTHVFAVRVEQCRAVTLGSNVHSTRRAFERGVESEVGAKSAMLWRMYFLFEVGNVELGKAKDVFYRAVRACPWVKGLYLLPFVHLREVVAVSELKGVYEMMVERELRIHVALEDVFEELESRKGNQSPGRVKRR